MEDLDKARARWARGELAARIAATRHSLEELHCALAACDAPTPESPPAPGLDAAKRIAELERALAECLEPLEECAATDGYCAIVRARKALGRQ